MAKITGLGGIFLVSADVDAARRWYREILGIDGPYGPQFEWAQEKGDAPYSLMSFFSDGEYLKPSTARFMINLRVDDLDAMVADLRAKDIEILDVADEGYGKFAWIMGPDDVKIELWQQCEAAPPLDANEGAES